MPVSEKLTYSVVDNKLTIDSIRTNAIEGNINLTGSITATGKLDVFEDGIFHHGILVGTDLDVKGQIKTSVLYADTIISKTQIEHKEPVVFSANNGGVEGKGMIWKHDKKNVDFFIFKKDPNRIFTNLNLDLYRGAQITIDGTPMFSVDTLGPSILNSNLRKVGRLKDLVVDGDVVLGEHIFFDAKSTRLGIGTDHANAAFSLVDNGIELVLGSLNDGQGNIGTFTSHDLGLITDNTTRMKITRGGKIIFGEPKAANADVTINGKLFVKELIVDSREERQSPLEFQAIGTSNYGKGMIFTGEGRTKQFLLLNKPEQFYSSEHINLEEGKSYYINKTSVLSSKELGQTVTKSYLTELGILKSLRVVGDINLNEVIKISDNRLTIGNALIDTSNGVSIIGDKITLQASNQSISINNNHVILGDKNNPSTHAIVNGKMSIGVQSIGDNAQLEIAGNIRFADKLFMVGSNSPSQGTYRKGDIVWNEDPKETGYIGWVCIRDGNPGIWRGFGQIGVE